jgi:serine/threonine-protein kinase
MGVADTVHLGRQLCDGVAAAHTRGVVHRDIKPSNLFIAFDETERESLKVVDFGIAAFRGQAQPSPEPKLTEQGNVIGTPEYMAPEQLLAQDDVDQRCDIYGIGVTLYECLTGAVPFEGNYARVLLQASTRAVPPLRSRRDDVPEELARVVERALARAPEDRYGDAGELGAALAEAARGLVGRTSLLGGGAVPLVEQALATIPAGPRHQPTTRPARIERSSQQRRRYRRVPYITPVSITRTADSTLYGRSEDISEGGLLVMTAQRCDEGEQVRIRFAVPGTGQFADTAAVVRWARKGRTIGVVGFEFADLPEEIGAAIRAYAATRADA